MKKSTIGIIVALVVIVVAVVVYFTMFANQDTRQNVANEINAAENRVETTVSEDTKLLEEDFVKIEEQAKEDIERAEEITEEEIHEAIDFIDENIEVPIEELDRDVAERLAYYGAYLKNLGEKEATAAEHEIAKLGEDVFTHLKNAYAEVEEETSKIANEIEEGASEATEVVKEEIMIGLEKIKEEKDKLVTEFKSLFNK